MEFSERGGYGFRVYLVLCWQAHEFYETLSTALLLYTPQYCFIFEHDSSFSLLKSNVYCNIMSRSFNERSVVVNISAMILSCDIQFHYYKTPFL